VNPTACDGCGITDWVWCAGRELLTAADWFAPAYNTVSFDMEKVSQ